MSLNKNNIRLTKFILSLTEVGQCIKIIVDIVFTKERGVADAEFTEYMLERSGWKRSS